MTELAMSDGNPPARVSLLTLVSFRGVGIFWETPGQFRVSSRQLLPWDYFRLARHPLAIGSKRERSFQLPTTGLTSSNRPGAI